MEKDRDEVIHKLIDIQYTRNEMDFRRGSFRVRGDVLEVFPAYSGSEAYRIEFFGDEVDRISEIDAPVNSVFGYRTSMFMKNKDTWGICS